jgi:hypothetical protein
VGRQGEKQGEVEVSNPVPIPKISYETEKDDDAATFDLIGLHVEKKFQNKWYVGVIIAHDFCATTGDKIWQVEYDDGDSADYTRREIEQILAPNLGEIL